MNFEIPPCDVLTRRFVIKPTQGVRTTTAHPTGDGGSRDMVENETCPIFKQISNILMCK